jgi:hypothetical protein
MFAKQMSKMILAAAALGLSAELAAAQSVCGQRKDIIATLDKSYAESRRAVGLVGQDGKGVIELFVSDKGTWTMLVTSARGNTCIIAAGLGWQGVPKQLAGAGI